MKERILSDELGFLEDDYYDDKKDASKENGSKVEKKGKYDVMPTFYSDFEEGTEEYKKDIKNQMNQWEARKKYDKYIKEHHPVVTPKKKDAKVAMASKILAATQLKKDDKTCTYSTKLIHIVAGKIEKALDMNNMTDIQLDRMIESQHGAINTMNDRMKEIYDVTGDPKAYIIQMKKVADNLMPKDRRTDEYKAFYDNVKAIANMDPTMDRNALRDELILANFDLMRSIDTYMKGKKSVRRDLDGRERFDNALDALSVLSFHTTGVDVMSNKLVNRINKVRGYKPGHKYYVDLSTYGGFRAENAKKKREEKKLEKTMKLENEKEKKIDRALKGPVA